MPRPSRIVLPILCAWLGLSGWRFSEAAEDSVFHHENVMGTSLELLVRADSPDAARRAERRVLDEIDRLSAIFSGYDVSSEFSRWQAGVAGPVKVSPELFELLAECDRWRTLSGGAFDPRVQALTRLWSRCAGLGRTPSPGELAEARALMGRPAWRLDPEARTVERLSDCPLSLNAIAKGYIVERACAAALGEGRGVLGLLLNVGGDLRVVGELTSTIGIASPTSDSETSEPLTTVEVRGRAVATSGNSQRGLRIVGRWYSHILDPRTGAPAEGVASASVSAERSADADALATILNVLTPEEGVRLVKSVPGADCLIVTTDGRVVRSEGWTRYERAIARADEPKEAGQATSWGDEFELAVTFEINQPEAGGRGYRRPYVAVWVEDKDGAVVRNVSLWVSMGGAGPYQWVPDLKRWYRDDQARRKLDKRDMIQTIARPTRPPGKYTVIWDGKDDHGKPVPPGDYTVFIDAAREHGTYQGMSKQVTIADRPFVEELKGDVEIKSASIEYRRKGQGK